MNSTIANLRLSNQQISRTTFEKPGDLVHWMGAVQAQDYNGALWAVGLRTRGATEADILKAVADRRIVRTWPMRRTLHFVAATDVRWMLELLAPRVIATSGPRHRQLELDDRVFARSRKIFVRAMEGGKQLRRDLLYKLLGASRISTAGSRGLHIVAGLALEGLICFGTREGKQPTLALLDEWVPASRTLERDEALATLAARYFTSHGPAALPDFVWWSGLRTAEARAALELAKPQLVEEVIDGKSYWLAPSAAPAKEKSPAAHLLPSFDEYTVAYKDRGAVLDPLYAKQASTGNGIFHPSMVVDGRVVGLWKRALKKGALVITPAPFEKLSHAETRALSVAAERFGEFIGAPIVWP